jgi:hypothetical protein
MTGNTSPETSDPGLPDGIFSKIWKILEGLEMEKVGIFNGHAEYTYYCHLGYIF